jgi:glycine cleavage system H lipoate-binding protein
MTVLLVLITFVLLLTVDYFYSKRRALRPIVEPEAAAAAPRLQAGVVAGFEVPDNVRYHPGHTWALSESPNLVRVGLDSFAARLAGKIDELVLPLRGQWVRQGQRLLTLRRDGQKAEMVSPIEGIIMDVNEAAMNDPELARRDPYGEGWLVKVQAPDAKTNFRNLIGGAVARRWMDEAAQRLRARMPIPAGAFAQDGGVALDDLASHLPDDHRWTELTREFFLI